MLATVRKVVDVVDVLDVVDVVDVVNDVNDAVYDVDNVVDADVINDFDVVVVIHNGLLAPPSLDSQARKDCYCFTSLGT